MLTRINVLGNSHNVYMDYELVSKVIEKIVTLSI